MMDGKLLDYETALNLLNITAFGNMTTKPLHAREYRRHVTRLKSLLGGSSLIVVEPMWNSVGPRASEWVYNTRQMLKDVESKSGGMQLYLEGMAPMIVDMADAVYETAPRTIIISMIVVVMIFTAIAFWSAFIGLRLLVTVFFSTAWIFGIVSILFQDIRVLGAQGDGLHCKFLRHCV